MNQTSRFETRIASPSQIITLRTLITDLRRLVQILDVDISAEEQRARVFNVREVNYPILAQTLRTRRENILATISALQASVNAGDPTERDRAA